MASYEYVAGDSGSKITLTARDAATKTIIDLTSFTAKVRYSLNGASIVERTMTNTDPTNGIAEYLWLSSELACDVDAPASGQIVGEFTITDLASHKVTSLNKFKVNIRAALA
jgi:hypothetical protein